MEYKYQQLNLQKQQGAVVIILAAGMAALLAVAGLALDTGNLFLNKSKLQNAADVSALSAGAALNAPGGTYQNAEDSAIARFISVISSDGNQKLKEAYDSNEISLAVTTSPTLTPFVNRKDGSDWYVRVSVSAMKLDSIFLKVIGIDTLSVPASAVAGRDPVGVQAGGGNNPNVICGVVPMMVCGDKTKVPSAGSTDFWGYKHGEAEVLKTSSKSNKWDVGSGNFQLIDLPGLSGGSGIREASAGGGACIDATQGDQITTSPGNTVGPVAQGLNTRFGIYNGPLSKASEEYPGDYVSGSPRGGGMTYDKYKDLYEDKEACIGFGCYAVGEDHRRLVSVPIGDCSESIDGKGQIPLLDMGCFFLNKKAIQKGNDSEVHGQFVEGCPVGTTLPSGQGPITGPASGTTPGGLINKAYKIQLYKNPASRDS